MILHNMKTQENVQTPIMHKKVLKGHVVSDKMDKTIVVSITRFIKHPKYQKFFKKSKKFKAHDEENTYKTGDYVEIMETRPISKDKTFKVIGLATY